LQYPQCRQSRADASRTEKDKIAGAGVKSCERVSVITLYFIPAFAGNKQKPEWSGAK
jgi:hypothetical protein